MAEDLTFTNVYMTYIQNRPYEYPTDNKNYSETNAKITTGYHVLPLMLWRHFVTPKQWAEMQIHYEAFHVKGYKITIFNMVPMTTQIAIQQTTTFTAFNNTIYAIGYQDNLYETSYLDWTTPNHLEKSQPNLAWKEGWIYNVNNTTRIRNTLPQYLWYVPHVRSTSEQTWGFMSQTNSGIGVYPHGQLPSGLFWDPLNRPSEIAELRPGKNAISFSWNCHAADESVWFNIDRLAAWYPMLPSGPYTVTRQRPGTYSLTAEDDPDLLSSQNQNSPAINDYTIANWATLPIVPCAWWWKEMQQSIIEDTNPSWQKKPDLHWPGTEAEQYKYPPTQCFIKMIPLFDDSGALINMSANVSIKVSLFLQAKKRRSAIYCPTWGPFAWLNVYSAKTSDMNFIDAYIRYRTGGMRRTWQNIAGNQQQDISGAGPFPHPREDPYSVNSTVPGGQGLSSTGLTPTTPTVTHTVEKLQPTVTYSAKDDTVMLPIAQKRKQKSTPSPLIMTHPGYGLEPMQ